MFCSYARRRPEIDGLVIVLEPDQTWYLPVPTYFVGVSNHTTGISRKRINESVIEKRDKIFEEANNGYNGY